MRSNLFFAFFLSTTSLASFAQVDQHFDLKPIGEEAFEVLKHFFQYDRSIPLDAKVIEVTEEATYNREKIVFTGLRGSRVPGLLGIPKIGEGPYPCVLILHGITGSKENWWESDLAERFLMSGYAVLTLDAVYHGERLVDNDYESPGVFTFRKRWNYKADDMIVQTAVEYRRALDYLSSRVEIDSNRFGMIGYSMGAMTVFSISSIDERISCAVACVAPAIEDPYSPKGSHLYASYIKDVPFLLLMGKTDPFYTVKQANQLYKLIGSDQKELVLYDSGHGLPPEWKDKAIDWLGNYLK
jgi:dienelactone hydrolase